MMYKPAAVTYLMVGLLDFILVLLQLGGISLLQRLLRQLLFMLLQKPVELLTEKKKYNATN